MWRVVVAAMMGLAGACGTGFPAAPREGGPRWTELTSEHFTVWTDGDPPRVWEVVRRMERFRQVMVEAAYPRAPASGRVLAIVLRNDRELREASNTHEARPFAVGASPPVWLPTINLSLSSSEQYTVAHELTHVVSSAVIRHQPRWLSEGMATYFESMQLNADMTMVTFGAESRRYRGDLHMAPISELFGWSGMSPVTEEHSLYQTAWALFTFLINEHKAELAHYLWLIDHASGPSIEARRAQQRAAWDEAFPSLPVEQLDSELQKWLFYGHHLLLKFYVQAQDKPVTGRTLSDADAYAIRAFVFGGPTPVQQARERGELAAALAVDPTNVLARVLKFFQGERIAVDEARLITSAHPDDWRAWWLATMALRNAHGDPSELDRAREQACTLMVRNRALVGAPQLCPASGTSESSR